MARDAGLAHLAAVTDVLTTARVVLLPAIDANGEPIPTHRVDDEDGEDDLGPPAP